MQTWSGRILSYGSSNVNTNHDEGADCSIEPVLHVAFASRVAVACIAVPSSRCNRTPLHFMYVQSDGEYVTGFRDLQTVSDHTGAAAAVSDHAGAAAASSTIVRDASSSACSSWRFPDEALALSACVAFANTLQCSSRFSLVSLQAEAAVQRDEPRECERCFAISKRDRYGAFTRLEVARSHELAGCRPFAMFAKAGDEWFAYQRNDALCAIRLPNSSLTHLILAAAF